MDTEKIFNSIISDESDYFPEICEMMFHSNVNEGRRFLCAMNNIVEYCYNQSCPNEECINYHIIYIHSCPKWARELLSRFLIHKIAFTKSNELISSARGIVNNQDIPEGLSGKSKQMKQIRAEKCYYKKYLSLFENKNLPDNFGKKSLLVLQKNDIETKKQNKNPWLDQLYTKDLFDNSKNVAVTTKFTTTDIENLIRNRQVQNLNIDNVYIFHSRNRGKITCSYNKDNLNRLNQYGLGIKNCYFFYISEKPFRLYRTQDIIKYTLSSTLLKRKVKRFNGFNGFITFTPEEVDTMFNRKNESLKYIVDLKYQNIFTTGIDSYFDKFPHNYRIKDALSLAFTESTRKEFLKKCEAEFGESISQPEIFLKYYEKIWKDKIKPDIETNISNCKSIAFILPKWATENQKQSLINEFKTVDRSIIILDSDSIGENQYAKIDMVVLFAYRYTDSRFYTYPNSFDPLPLKPDQKGLTIINRLTHNRYYEWNKYFYDKAYQDLLYSDFRKDKLGWSKQKFCRPTLPDIFDNIYEAEADAREYMAEKCVIQFENKNNKIIKPLSSSRVIYNDGQNYCITSLKDLPFEEGMKIQLLDEIIDQVKNLLDEKTDTLQSEEYYIRRDPTYHLTESESSSNVELWKYLLKRKVEATSIKDAYNAIFPVNKEISIQGFERWIDFNYTMIFPRNRNCQNNLLTYLGFTLRGPYHRLILTKKLTRNNDTRILNSRIESLLNSILTVSEVKEQDYPGLYNEHSEIMTLLEIKSANDLNTLVKLLDIKLNKVKSIEYDS